MLSGGLLPLDLVPSHLTRSVRQTPAVCPPASAPRADDRLIVRTETRPHPRSLWGRVSQRLAHDGRRRQSRDRSPAARSTAAPARSVPGCSVVVPGPPRSGGWRAAAVPTAAAPALRPRSHGTRHWPASRRHILGYDPGLRLGSSFSGSASIRSAALRHRVATSCRSGPWYSDARLVRSSGNAPSDPNAIPSRGFGPRPRPGPLIVIPPASSRMRSI